MLVKVLDFSNDTLPRLSVIFRHAWRKMTDKKFCYAHTSFLYWKLT